jgi:hypothetical protein
MTTLTVKPSQLHAILTQAIPARLPVLITGAPGIGKTDCEARACAEVGADNITMHPVVKDPTDFKGMPWVTEGGAAFIPFGDLQQLMQASRPTVCFLDDLGQATPAVQAAAMQLILGRQIDGHRIADSVVFMAASNRRGDRAGVNGLLEPVKSRFSTIVELVPDLNEWGAWAVSAGVASEVIAFLRFRPPLFCDFKPTADLTNSPCPRTWHHVSRWLARDLSEETRFSVIQGAVGEGAATEFVAFLRIWEQMVSPDLVLTAPDTAPIPTEPSALYAVSVAIATRVQKESMSRYCRYLERLCRQDHSEFAAVSLQTATARDASLSNTAGFVQAMSGPLGQLMVGGG